MYACGITVSGEAHIGHAEQAIIFDIIRKYLEKKGYNVTYARNYIAAVVGLIDLTLASVGDLDGLGNFSVIFAFLNAAVLALTVNVVVTESRNINFC